MLSFKISILAMLLGLLMLTSPAFAQRRIFTNEDIQSAPSAAPPAQAAQPSVTPQGSQPAASANPTPPAAPASPVATPTASPEDQVGAAAVEVRRLIALRESLMQVSDLFFDKSREGNVDAVRLSNWNQIRDSLTLAMSELEQFIAQARRNLPLDAPPAAQPAQPAQR